MFLGEMKCGERVCISDSVSFLIVPGNDVFSRLKFVNSSTLTSKSGIGVA